MARVSLPSPEDMNPAQRAVYDDVVAGPRGRLVGPLRAVIHSPELAGRWSKFGEFLRYSTCLPPRLNELAIIVTGRRWNSQIEFHIHAEAARVAGLSDAIIDAIRVGQTPPFSDEEEIEIYEFTRMLQDKGVVSDEAHTAVKRRWGERGVVELTAVIGYYTMVSMMLNAHEIPLPQGVAPPLAPVRDDGLTQLPPAASESEAA
mgnify:CR=1 FL=1